LYELHPADADALAMFAGDDSRIRVERRDGFKACIALLPPPERRGLIVMDPSYELKTDYRDVVQTLAQAWRRFPTGVYALWYPVIERRRVNTLERALQASGIQHVQLFELGVRGDGEGSGMSGSGMIVVNAPYTLAAEMADTLPWLARTLGQESGGYYRLFELDRPV
ncbi:MAG: 23S rRNA (adenine(2030)-N(6))-methyltransferase RlmJ, partial [Chromatiales bacterium]|nr:23S rRNA (adenine(2030)-N(6))-methyltransferase RlmJ [Chromatiales bacterium]